MNKNAQILTLPPIKKTIADKRVPDNEMWLCWQPTNGKEIVIAKIEVSKKLLKELTNETQ